MDTAHDDYKDGDVLKELQERCLNLGRQVVVS